MSNFVENFEKNKEEMIFQLLLSLNADGAGYVENRLDKAVKQYDQLLNYFKSINKNQTKCINCNTSKL